MTDVEHSIVWVGIRRLVIGCVLGGALAASVAPSPSSTMAIALTIINLDGPVANVLISGQKVATLHCWDRPLTLAPGTPGLPPLPWSVEILDISGSPPTTIGSRVESGDGQPSTIVIRADHLELASLPPAPDPSCPPAPSGDPLY